MKKFLVALLVLAGSMTAGFSEQVAIKVTGGLVSIKGGDYNDGLAGLNALLRATSIGSTGAYQPLDHGLQGQVEIVNAINSHLAVGLGGGYFRVSGEGRVSVQGLAPSGTSLESRLSGRVSVIPLFLNLHYLTRLVAGLSLDAYAGPVFYVVQFNFDDARTFSLDALEDTITFAASQTAWGGQAGLGLAYKLVGGLSLVADGCYRFGTVSDLQGNWADLGTSAPGPVNESSALTYLWFYKLAQGSAYDQLAFADSAPAGPGVSGVRRARIDLSGLALSTGFKFGF
jgi:hypothetical protein